MDVLADKLPSFCTPIALSYPDQQFSSWMQWIFVYTNLAIHEQLTEYGLRPKLSLDLTQR